MTAIAVVVACNRNDAEKGPERVTTPAAPAASPTVKATPTMTPVPLTALPSAADGFALPVAGACLPENPDLLPGAPRTYRDGTHEGVDLYDDDNCASIGLNTEVLAAKAGTVIRADVDYEVLTEDDLERLDEEIAAGNGGDPEIEDIFRGRQVWVDHGGGIVTRYAHLNAVPRDIEEGTEVAQGELIGYVGDSGSPEAVTAPGTQVHLHFEIRVGGTYLGRGLSPAQTYELYQRAFGLGQ